MYGIVYKATNKINGKSYVGQTTKTLEQRIYDHKYKVDHYSNLHFHNALRKHNFNNFEWLVIEKCKDDLDLAEQWYIRKFDTYKNGYNMTFGGDFNPSLIPEIAKKISEAHKGKKLSGEHKKKISVALTGENNPAKRSEVRKKISLSKIGDKNPARRKDIKQKISISTTGEKHWNWGKYLSKETKKKISLKHKGKTLSEEHKEKLRKATKNVNKVKCEYCNRMFYPWHISRYHSDKCKNKK